MLSIYPISFYRIMQLYLVRHFMRGATGSSVILSFTISYLAGGAETLLVKSKMAYPSLQSLLTQLLKVSELIP